MGGGGRGEGGKAGQGGVVVMEVPAWWPMRVPARVTVMGGRGTH